MPAPSTKSYTAGHFELMIDGHKSTAFLKSIEGGGVKANVSDEAVAGNTHRVKHMSTVDVEPFSLEFGMSGANDVLQWIQGSWNRQWDRRNGSVTHADFNLKDSVETEFYNALVTETTIPTLDATSKESGYLKCKIQPETVLTKKTGGQLKALASPKQKLWTPSSFRLNIDQVDDMQYTNKIESFTIKQSIKKFYTGAGRFPQCEPTKIEYPNISGTISLAYADQLLQWQRDYVEKGKKDKNAQRTGSIEFLSPDRKQTIFRINLFQLGLIQAAVMPSTANQDQIKRVKFEMYVHRMELDGSGKLGFE